MARAAALNPAILSTVSSNYFDTKPQFTKTGQNILGQDQYGFVRPNMGEVSPYNAPGSMGAVGGNQPGAAPPPGAPSVPNSGAPPATPGANYPVSPQGQAVLNQLPPGYASRVMGILTGREPPPAEGSRSPIAQGLLTMAAQIEPNFDLVKWKQRFDTNNEFHAGGLTSPAGQITSGNTAMQHLAGLSDAAQNLGNGSFPMVNGVKNWLSENTGNPQVPVFNDWLNRYTQEITKFYRGTGGSEADIARDIAALNDAKSPAQLNSVIAAQGQGIYGKINALQDRWHEGMGPGTPDFPIIQPESQAALSRVNGRNPAQAPQAGTPPLDQARAAIARGAPRAAVMQRLQQNGIDPAGL